MKVFDQNWKHVETQNQRTGTSADFTIPWYDYQKQPPEVLYKKTTLKDFARSTRNTCVGVYFLKKLKTFRPATLLKRDPNTGAFLWILQNF